MAFHWPLAALFGVSVLIGLSVGLVTTAGITLLQASSDTSEMGRVTAAHQFVRLLAIMYGVGLSGAVILLVVDLEVGSVDAVRDLIAGEDIGIGAETQDAIRHGLAWVHVVTGTISIGSLMIANVARSPVTHSTARDAITRAVSVLLRLQDSSLSRTITPQSRVTPRRFVHPTPARRFRS